MLHVGDKAPQFSLSDERGEKINLKELLGKKVVLYFYPKDDTPGCTKQACAFNDLRETYAKHNAVIYGVSADSIESHKKFKEKYALQFSLLSDEKKEVCKEYGVWKKKSLYGKTYMGIERTTFIIGEKGKIEHIIPKVKVDGHGDDLLNLLREERV